MNLVSLLQTLRTAVTGSAAISAWCQDNYQQEVKVFIGLDERDPPAESDYPLVHLFPQNKETGLAVADKQHVFGATAGICDETAAGDNELPQVAKLEAFRVLVQAAMLAALPDGITCNRISTEYETVGLFPFFLVTSEFTVEQSRQFRDDPYE